MYCMECGNEIAAEAKFCNKCGTIQNDEAVIKLDSQSISPASILKSNQSPSAPKSLTTNSVLIGAFLAVIVGLIGYSLWSNKKAAEAVLASHFESGRKIYAEGKGNAGVTSCNTCHGENGEASELMGIKQIAGTKQEYVLNQLNDYAEDKRVGVGLEGVMNGFAKALSVQERSDVATYVSIMGTSAAPKVTSIAVNAIKSHSNNVNAQSSDSNETSTAPVPAAAAPVANETYEALFTCGMGSSGHINILACFAGGSDGADTELEIQNGEQYGMYKAYNLLGIGSEDSQGFHVHLKNHFSIKAQNSQRTLILSLKIRDSTGKVVFEKSASQYGVISVKN